MADVLVLIDYADDAVAKPSLELLTLARRIGTPVAVVVGAPPSPVVEKLGAYGAGAIISSDGEFLASSVTAGVVALLASAVSSRDVAAVLLPSTPEGKEIAGRLAVRLDAG